MTRNLPEGPWPPAHAPTALPLRRIRLTDRPRRPAVALRAASPHLPHGPRRPCGSPFPRATGGTAAPHFSGVVCSAPVTDANDVPVDVSGAHGPTGGSRRSTGHTPRTERHGREHEHDQANAVTGAAAPFLAAAAAAAAASRSRSRSRPGPGAVGPAPAPARRPAPRPTRPMGAPARPSSPRHSRLLPPLPPHRRSQNRAPVRHAAWQGRGSGVSVGRAPCVACPAHNEP